MNESGRSSAEESMEVLYEARVATREDPLTLRSTPGGKKIGKLPIGTIVCVLDEGEWARVRCGEQTGYVSAQYLERIEDEQDESGMAENMPAVIIDDEGNCFRPAGGWRVVFGGVD